MSDSIKKWHEMQEEKKSNQSATSAGTFIYESPDGGKTVTQRPFNGDISDSSYSASSKRGIRN